VSVERQSKIKNVTMGNPQAQLTIEKFIAVNFNLNGNVVTEFSSPKKLF
jgi:hypothetical protein